MNSGQQYELDEAKKMIERSLEKNTYKVNFTGGDPLAQSEAVSELARFVQLKKISSYLESSCYDSTRFAQVLPYLDFIKIEFKTPDSEFVDSKHYSKLLENELDCLRLSVESKKVTYIKVVVSSKTELGPFKKLLKRIFQSTSKSSKAMMQSLNSLSSSLKTRMSLLQRIFSFILCVNITCCHFLEK